MEIQHREGKKHGNADALSRRPCRQCSIDEENTENFHVQIAKVSENTHLTNPISEPFDTEQMKNDYAKDPQLSNFHALFSSNEKQVPWSLVVGLDPTTKNLWNQWKRLHLANGVLYRSWTSVDGLHIRWQLVPPKSIQNQIMKMAHTGMTGGHLGIKRTQHQVQLRAYWPGWSEDVARFCRQCNECSTYHRGLPPKQGSLQVFPVGESFQRISIDLTGPHRVSRSNNVYILTVVDNFSKWAEGIPLRNKEAVTVARALMDVVFARFGLPLELLSDNGKEFDNQMLKEVCRLLGVDKLRTTVYKASTNGAVERFHRTLNSMLGKVVSIHQKDWDEMLPSVMAAYRASRHEATGYSPNFLMFGRENMAPLDVVYGIPDGEESHYESYDAYVDYKLDLMRKAYQLAREHLGVRAERSKRNYDIRVHPRQFHVGQWVFYYSPRRYIGRSPKWQRMYTGPFLITKIMGPVNVQLTASRRATPFISHIDKLKHCLGEHPSSWIKDEDPDQDMDLNQQLFELNDESIHPNPRSHSWEDERESVPFVSTDQEEVGNHNSGRKCPPTDQRNLATSTIPLMEVRSKRERTHPKYLQDFIH
jgi:transposase InsO family protein